MNIFCFMFLFVSGFFAYQDLKEIRQQYADAVLDSGVADKLLKRLSDIKDPAPLMLGYKGAAEALIAKHAVNPYTKLKMLKVSEQTLKEAIAKDPVNVELRFLRFSIQHYVPEWLGFSKDLKEDKMVMVEQLPSVIPTLDKDLGNGIVDFLIESGRCSEEDLHVLKKLKKD